MDTVKVSNVEAICLILVIFMNHLILSIPQTILIKTGSSAIINVIFITLIALIFIYLIIKLTKPFINQDIIDISYYLGGKILKWIIGGVSFIYAIIISSILIRDFADFIKLVHFERFPIYFILLFFVLTAIIGNFFGKKAIFRTNLIIVPIVAIGLLITFCSIIPNYTLERIFPIFGNGVSETFFTGLSNLSAFGGLFYLFFIKPSLKEIGDFGKVGIISTIIMGLFLLLSVTSLLLSFPFVTEVEELSPLYYITSIVGSGTFFQRTEAIFMLTWILSIISYLTVTVNLCVYIFKKLIKPTISNGICIPITLVIFILALIPPNIAIVQTLEEIFYTYSSITLIMIVFLIVLVLAYIKHRKQKGDYNE